MTVSVEQSLAAIHRVRSAATRARPDPRATAARIAAVARLGEGSIDATRWIQALGEAIHDQEKTGLVPSLFDIMGLYGSERHHNRALAWLLAPNDLHGAGRIVLLEIARSLGCDTLAEDIVAGDDIQVRAEKRWPAGVESPRQPDLLILSPRALLLIENKVRSLEGDNQYSDYLDALEQLADTQPAKQARSYLCAPEERPVPERWTGMLVHRDLAACIRRAAQSSELNQWGRALCLLVAEEINPTGRARQLRDAKVLFERVRGGNLRAREARQVQEMVEQLEGAAAPWRD